MRNTVRGLIGLGALALATSVAAIEPIPDTPGWSGSLTISVASFDNESNMVAGIDLVSYDAGNATIDSLDESPDSVSEVMPQLNFNVNYTFRSRVQLFLGNSLEDVIELDTASVLGVRKQFKDKSILELSAVSTPFIAPIEVWADPYVVGVERTRTDRVSRGARIEYDRILGTGLGIQLTRRKTEIDDELSGLTQLRLTPGEARLLAREGDVSRVFVKYRFKPVGKTVYELGVGRRTADLDGEAMSGDQDQIQLNWLRVGKRFVCGGAAFYWQQDYDAVNPVFDVTRDDETTGLSLNIFDTKMFRNRKWWGQLTAVWVQQNANIDFYDAGSLIVGLGVRRMF